MKALIIYKSKYGAARQYAGWVHEETGIPLKDADDVTAGDLKSCDVLILGSSVYIGKMLFTDWIKKHSEVLAQKKIFLFMVSGAPPSEREKLMEYLNASIDENIQRNCKFYFFHGRMILKNLNWKDRILLKMGSWMVKDPDEKKGMLKEYDDVKKEYIAGMVADIKAAFSLTP